MGTRLRDLLLASLALVVTSPLLAVVAVAIRLSDPGPAFYRARRAGRGGRPFTMLKFRTMRVGNARRAISSADDDRVFPLGALLRRTKIDELPQLFNVLRGEMSLVGPRPEDFDIVQRFYLPWQMETLTVPPGLASPGSLYNYTHGERMLAGPVTDGSYVESLLPVKLALDMVYVGRRSAVYDLQLIWRTITTIGAIVAGRRRFPEPPEMVEAAAFLSRVSRAS